MIAPPRAAAIPVGLAAIGVSSDAECQLVAHGVGSCVIVCAWDPVSRIAGMAHVVQPQSPAAAPADTARYADRAVPALLARMRAAGADPTHLLVKLVGGASVLRPASRSACSTSARSSPRSRNKASAPRQATSGAPTDAPPRSPRRPAGCTSRRSVSGRRPCDLPRTTLPEE
jgi:hypothetical protein